MSRPLILLEFDDVIVISHDARLDALRQAAAADEVTFSDTFFDEQCAGQSFAAAARALYSTSPFATDETAMELATARAGRNYAKATARGLMLMPEVGEFLRHQAERARLGLVAVTPATEVHHLLELAGLTERFDSIVCDDDGGTQGSLVELWERARARLLRRESALDAEVVAIVASASAFEAARTAGCRPSFMAAGSRAT